MRQEEETNNIRSNIANKDLSIFTDFEGIFKARLSAVIPVRITNTTENAPISAKYECRVKAVYHKDLMGLIEEGMILAVKNFRSKLDNTK